MLRSFAKDFAPWIIFGVLVATNILSIPLSALCALVIAVFFDYSRLRHGFIIDWGTVIFFLILVLGPLLFFFPWIERHIGPVSSGMIAGLMWISVLAKKPFTAQYAKKQAPSRFRKSALFYTIHVRLSIVWALLLTTLTVLSSYGPTASSWVIPTIIFTLGVTLTKWFPKYYKNKMLKPLQVPRFNIENPYEVMVKGKMAIIRPAKPSDAKQIAEFVILASGGVIEFLLQDMDEEDTVAQDLQKSIEMETGDTSYINTTVCELQGTIVGVIHALPEEYNSSILKRGLLPKERLDHLAPLFSSKLPNSLYLQTIAVHPEFQGMGVGDVLIRCFEKRGKIHDFASLSLHVWADNEKALHWYQRKGFKKEKKLAIPEHPLLPHKGGMIFMSKPL